MTTSMEIKAADVQSLRQITGAGLMDCKAALVEAKGDREAAIRILREKGIAKSSKRADRVAAEGTVEAWVSPSGQEGILLELNSETDFVARNDEFLALAKSLVQKLKDTPSITEVAQLPQDGAEALSAKVGEKISIRRFARLKAAGAGVVASYIHPGSKLGVLVQVDSGKGGAPSADLVTLGRELALQIAGANPAYISRTDVPADVLEREKDIVKKQMEGQNKPAEMLEKIATGKLTVFYEAQCLLDQPHVKDPSGKTKVQSLVDAVAKKDGGSVVVSRFVRFRVGAE